MKNFLILLILLSLFLQTDCKAAVEEENPIEKKGDGNNDGPKSMPPVITTYVAGDVLSISVSNYVGTVQVVVSQTNSVWGRSQNYYVNGMDTINIDFTSSTSGSYVVSLVLQNGDEYEGVIRKV